MKDIYLIRHTTPAVAKGICYGQTDLELTESFREEAETIRSFLPATIRSIYSSPLQRCTRLAEYLFPGQPLSLQDHLMEVFCGQWEMRSWDELPKEEIDPWMADFVNIRIPGGESYIDLHERVTRCWEQIRGGANGGVVESALASGDGAVGAGAIAVVAHGGVIRSILSHITGTPLIDSFKAFALYYGCVVRVYLAEGGVRHEILYNRAPPEREQHKPSGYYK